LLVYDCEAGSSRCAGEEAYSELDEGVYWDVDTDEYCGVDVLVYCCDAGSDWRRIVSVSEGGAGCWL
jgi:hypothetical protein